MLPRAYHDLAVYNELAPESWRAVFDAARESERLDAQPISAKAVLDSLTAFEPGKMLLEALKVVHELGTDLGRELIRQVAAAKHVTLSGLDAKPARELAASLWIEAQTNTAVFKVLQWALIGVKNEDRQRKEFASTETVPAKSLEHQMVLEAVEAWCRDHQGVEVVDVWVRQQDGDWHCEIVRGDAVKSLLHIKDHQVARFDYQPALSDHVRFEPELGRLGVASQSARVTQMYREVFGQLIGGRADFFSNENVCTLRPLQQQASAIFERHRTTGILRVDVVELRWRHGDRDKLLVSGRDCFDVLKRLHARLTEGELIEAKLSVVVVGGRRPIRVRIKVPDVIDIPPSMHEASIEEMLTQAGIRGSFNESVESRSFWDRYPWKLSDNVARQVFGRDFDQLRRLGIIRQVSLEEVSHPDHQSAIGALEVFRGDDGTIAGIGSDSFSVLTESHTLGYELEWSKLSDEIARHLELTGERSDLGDGIWILGRRMLVPNHSIAIFIAYRRPSQDVLLRINASAHGDQALLVVPDDCAFTSAVPCVSSRLPAGPHGDLLGAVVKRLGLQDTVPPWVWIRDDLIFNIKSGKVWYRKVELVDLQVGTHPYKFALLMARSSANLVEKATIRKELSTSAGDDQVARQARTDFIARVRSSYKKIGQTCPSELDEFFKAVPSRGYKQNGTAKVLE
ncbi:MAG: hypothetical protein WDO56_15945 [Gammaproteobacteria bacterium]